MTLVTVLASSFFTRLEDRSLVEQLDEEVARQGVDVIDNHPLVFYLELSHPGDLLLLTPVTALSSLFSPN